MRIKKIRIEDININDERFRIPSYFSLDSLEFSLKEIGIINPPVVTFRDSRLIPVIGWKRILVCRKISLSPILVFLHDEKNDLEAFKIAVYDNFATREFSPLEKAEILKKFEEFGADKKSIIEQYMPLLDIPPTHIHQDAYMSVSRIEKDLKAIIQKKKMLFASIQLLAGFKPREQRLILPLLLPMSQNKQKEILEDLQDISQKENISVEEVLASEEFGTAFDTNDLSPVQKSDKVRFMLKKRRYPTLFKWKDSFESILKKIQWPKEITINPSPFFEDEHFFLKFSFKNHEELKKNLVKLQKLSSDERFAGIFKNLFHD
ncbi:hypothetical protein ACFLRM_02800 [Acidobacteriota bacterium]